MFPYVTINKDSLQIVDRFYSNAVGDFGGREAPHVTFIQVEEPLNLYTVKAIKDEEENIVLVEDEELAEYMRREPDRIRERHTRIMKNKRNDLLLKSDWTQFPNSPLSETKKQEWDTYRQALRDLPANTTDPENPIWPTPPE